ncbi:MAG: hydantoinase/oxoprolinase family protein [Burkholderiales bacterium]|nr:hydantoinase/oxoprolinase family protein [Burkholderiales bacterium]
MSIDGRIVRIASDIGGTFTDVVLEIGERHETAKVLTRHDAPQFGVLEGMDIVLARTGVKPVDIDLMIHGTTLATNAIIERRGARVVLVTTQGFRDTLEIRTESRFEQYDLNISYPEPLVPREHRLTVPERLDARGRVVIPLDETALGEVVAQIRRIDPQAIAIGLLHSYVDPVHEARVRAVLAAAFPDVPISISSEVSQEMREFARLSTACANAYVQPLIAAYVRGLDDTLKARGFACPLLLMSSGGGLTDVDTAIRFPVRLVESGPAGGAVYARDVALQCGLDHVLSFDMGGTTAKLCLITDGQPQTAREFEVARAHRFRKGSGIPLRIPVVELVEIGAGGGSIARLDALKNIAVGPESAGSEPGPACYARGGTAPTVTDANLVLGRLDSDSFAGGRMTLDTAAARRTLAADIGDRLGLDCPMTAFGVVEMVEENMVGAARVHAIESGRDIETLTMIAFGGGAPLHAGPMARKLGITRFIVPTLAGVGSAVGFLRTPVSYEVVRTFIQRLDRLDVDAVNRTLAAMTEQARSIVVPAALGAAVTERRVAYLRYWGQGHEVGIDLPVRMITAEDVALFVARFESRYRELFTWLISNAAIEVVSWAVSVSAQANAPRATLSLPAETGIPLPIGTRRMFDDAVAAYRNVAVYARAALSPGDCVRGPSVIVEDETSTYVPACFEATIDQRGFIDCRRQR